MATPLDVGLLQKFDVVFPFLLIIVVTYVALTRINYFKENQAYAFIIAFALGVLSLFNTVVIKTINMMAPWFVLLFIFMLLIFMAYTAFGVKEDTIIGTITTGNYAKDFGWWVFAIVLIIGLGSLSTVISQEKGFTPLTTGENASVVPEGAGTEETGFWETLFHPKILGLVLIFMIAMFTISRLAQKSGSV